MTSCQQIVTSLLILRFMVNLEQSGRRILDAQSVKLPFSLIVTFYLTQTENRTKKSLTQLSYYCFEYCFHVSCIILTSFRKWGEGGGGNSTPHLKTTPKKSTQVRVKQLCICSYSFIRGNDAFIMPPQYKQHLSH